LSEDSSRLVHGLAANVVTDQPRLPRRGPHVLGLRAHNRRGQIGIALAPPARGRWRRRRLIGLPRLPPTPRPPCRLWLLASGLDLGLGVSLRVGVNLVFRPQDN